MQMAMKNMVLQDCVPDTALAATILRVSPLLVQGNEKKMASLVDWKKLLIGFIH